MIIYKYHFELSGLCLVPMGENDKVLHVAAQQISDTLPTIWVQHEHVPTDAREQILYLVGTGQSVPTSKDTHVGSAVCADGAFVWHVYRKED